MPNKFTPLINKLLSCLLILTLFVSLVWVQIALADTTSTTFNQTINEGTLSIDIVDAAGDVVVSPAVTFGPISFAFDAQDSTGTLGVSTEKIRVSNPTTTVTWNVSMAATSGADTPWTTGTYNYPFDSTGGADTGRLSVDPSGSTITAVGSGCTTTNIYKGSSAFFLSGTTDSVDLMGASSGADTLCRWDQTGISLSQRVPASQEPGSYSIAMTLTVI
ncbi:MAG: hypothetical protein GX943_03150 [Candidatus Pacebacteria bacterium]|nr:hypothetical protein [Candidatus Paceibacterota bacterium]